MIPTDRADVLDASTEILTAFARDTGVRGRFVAIYLGLRLMGPDLAPLATAWSTPSSDIEAFLDNMFTKTNRVEPRVVLSAMFGGAGQDLYGTRSGEIAPGNRYPTNRWRNNFAIQKGVGCPAAPHLINQLLRHPSPRLECPHRAVDGNGDASCQLSDTAYRGEDHSIWLHITDDGYQVADLDARAVYRNYLSPGGQRIPIAPLLASLYSLTPVGVYPDRNTVGIADFATDFAFSLLQVEDLFDCDLTSARNAAMLAVVQGAPAPGIPIAPGPPLVVADAAPEVPDVAPETQVNNGIGAEILVANELKARGWTVGYRANQRVYGYDLEATRGGETIQVEVKSSVGRTTPILTNNEWRAATVHGNSYVLAVVDFFGGPGQQINLHRDPLAHMTPSLLREPRYRFDRPQLDPHGTVLDNL